ncbi:VOC family protein [Paenibacillus ginsengihumi]|uniref:VOC family protein n=1 Tax=Paenibacillus ginsengihumi TaxID=431596 RepID=UPI000381EDFE|nr:VOC family protein [Paenibacillus ginsengihumi]
MSLQLTPFILLDGTAAEAIAFYEHALSAVVVFKQTFGEAPEDHAFSFPDEARDRIAHSVLKIGDAELFVADSEPGQPLQQGNLISICISVENVEQAKRLFDALKEGGQVNMPLQEVYFSPGYGVVTDKFGAVFQIFTKRG